MTGQVAIMCYYKRNTSSIKYFGDKAKGDPLTRAARAATKIRDLAETDKVANQTIDWSDSRLSVIVPCLFSRRVTSPYPLPAIPTKRRYSNTVSFNGILRMQNPVEASLYFCLCLCWLNAAAYRLILCNTCAKRGVRYKNRELEFALSKRIRKKRKKTPDL